MIRFYIIASGSKGNCCVVQSKHTTILIDCGYKIRYMKEKFKEYHINHFDAMLVTHTHSDHIKQIDSFRHVKTYSPHILDVDELVHINVNDTFNVNDIKITTLPLSHDVKDTVGFIFEVDNESLVYICDTGYVSQQVQDLIHDKTYYIMESNYDLEMLMESKRSMFLKQRIAGDNGHLSNEDCADILSDVVGLNTKQVFLAHLSQECNDEEIAYTTTYNRIPNFIDLFIAKQDEVMVGGKV